MKIFGKKKDLAEKVTDLVGSGVDKLFYTREEQADDLKASHDQYLEFITKTLGESTVRSITRRKIACKIVDVELLLVLAAAVAYKFDPEYAKFLLELAKFLGTAFLAVVIFFFGTYAFIHNNPFKKKAKL
ncbi:hypothetical protein DF185_19935 [Marinifilum breve]|uniref:Uncharacterized protein n=1 Tax=Marinifilum breve TaxID=2184082 RepID=A0A2V3ZV57_9BACT|nr:hypothetical protein [Marinifilum breve]PXX96913.1 hypothetical protein DF185_19935 [Marinifilum breve]